MWELYEKKNNRFAPHVCNAFGYYGVRNNGKDKENRDYNVSVGQDYDKRAYPMA